MRIHMQAVPEGRRGFEEARPASGWTRLCLVAEVPGMPPALLAALHARVAEEPGLALLLLRDAAGLGRDWAGRAARRLAGADVPPCGLEAALARLPAGAILVLLEPSPGAALWLGGVRGHRVLPLPAATPEAIDQAIAWALRDSLGRDPGFA